MIKSIRIKQVHTNTLSCEPLVRRLPNGDLLCACQCDGPSEPHDDNRTYIFRSTDNGETWSERVKLYPEDGKAVYITELSVIGNELTAYLTVHKTKFLHWDCVMMKSFDNGYTWTNYGPPPHLPEYTFIRNTIRKANGEYLLTYMNYPVEAEDVRRIEADDTIENKSVCRTTAPYCESGVLISADEGKTFEKFVASRADMSANWIWSEPTVAELSDGRLAMIMRRCRTWHLWYTESADGGRTWSETVQLDIPNPGNKSRLIKCGDKIALIHTPNPVAGSVDRCPLALWISDDDMKTWKYKTVLTDFPGDFEYSDGFYEDGHILFTIEHNRHTILFFDVELDDELK